MPGHVRLQTAAAFLGGEGGKKKIPKKKKKMKLVDGIVDAQGLCWQIPPPRLAHHAVEIDPFVRAAIWAIGGHRTQAQARAEVGQRSILHRRACGDPGSASRRRPMGSKALSRL